MINFEVKNQFFSIEFIINNIKLLLFENIEKQYSFNKTIINYFSKVKESEFALHYENVNKVLLNSETLNINDFHFYYVDEHFDLDNDLKLGSKSLSLDFLNSMLDNIEYDDNYINVSVLLDDIFTNIIEDDDYLRANHILSKKLLMKLINLELIKEDLVLNSNDLNYNEIIIFQLKLIEKISKKIDKNIIVLINIPFLNREIYEYIDKIRGITIITPLKITQEIDVNESSVITKNSIIDLLDEENLYENLNFTDNNCSTIEEYRNYITTSITNKFIN